MRKATAILAGFLCLVGACANNDQLKSPPRESPQKAVEVPTLQELTEDMARRRAQTHLALRNWSWGDPEQVMLREDKFYVYYKTPERELRLLGARVLIVDRRTGLVTAQKRR